MKLEKARFRDPVEFSRDLQSNEWNRLLLPETTMSRDGDELVLHSLGGQELLRVPMSNVTQTTREQVEPPPMSPEGLKLDPTGNGNFAKKPATSPKKKTKKQPAKTAASKTPDC